MNVEYKIEAGTVLLDRTHQAVMFCRNVLLLSEIPGTLTIKIFKAIGGQDLLGDCTCDGIDAYEMRLWEQSLETIMHEMVHVMQYANYELELYLGDRAYWQGEMVFGFSYDTSPWEIEATRLESILVKNFLTFSA